MLCVDDLQCKPQVLAMLWNNCSCGSYSVAVIDHMGIMSACAQAAGPRITGRLVVAVGDNTVFHMYLKLLILQSFNCSFH